MSWSFLPLALVLAIVSQCSFEATSSPPVTGKTRARMTINSFEKGGDGGGPSECDGRYRSNTEKVVALSTGWYDHGRRCLKHITINYKGRTTTAKVVDECDTGKGCGDTIVDASRAVWNALGVPKSEIGDARVTWSDAGS
ncbi:putative ripening-related protein 2 [Asparagus officinalis]|uniref:putative ripening-related protein 2 n=1 Tax=Asparagus officinalis TaxID=4686 RepID=UPI00098E2ED4|nr:putative ripening-related protein 2 [Asparagus officinalis]